ncbi:MAG: hypothetical protein VKI81_08090 [Synechococcaceae cyanobacterium]|nr:hypothetical protein [Synechococcaceae cyanobacterium]
MDHAPPSAARLLPLRELSDLGRWLAEALNHAFGNPREEALHLPPAVGVQPYRHRPVRRR